MDQEIALAEQAIAQQMPRFLELQDTDARARQQLRLLEIQQQSMRDKQARLSRFANRAERDSWLQSEINTLQSNLAARKNDVCSSI